MHGDLTSLSKLSMRDFWKEQAIIMYSLKYDDWLAREPEPYREKEVDEDAEYDQWVDDEILKGNWR